MPALLKEPLNKSPRRMHLRVRVVCRVANARLRFLYELGLFYLLPRSGQVQNVESSRSRLCAATGFFMYSCQAQAS